MGIMDTARELGCDTGEESLHITDGQDVEGVLVVSIPGQVWSIYWGEDAHMGGFHGPSDIGGPCHRVEALPHTPQVGLSCGGGKKSGR